MRLAERVRALLRHVASLLLGSAFAITALRARSGSSRRRTNGLPPSSLSSMKSSACSGRTGRSGSNAAIATTPRLAGTWEEDIATRGHIRTLSQCQ